MAKVLVCSYVADEATTYASYWARQVGAVFSQAGHQVQYVSGTLDNIGGVTQALTSFDPDLVLFAGHGNGSIMTGSGIQPMIQACQNDQILSGRSVMFIACLTGLSLAGSIVSKGGQAVQAFVTELQFITDSSGNPASDPYAVSFTNTIVGAARAIASGGSWADWLSSFRSISRQEIAKWQQNATDPFASSVVMCLENNLSGAVVNGAGTVDGGGTPPSSGGSVLVPVLIGVGILIAVTH